MSFEIPSRTMTWIKRLRQAPQAHLRLFCFPAAGAGANSYLAWTGGLPPSIEVFGIQLPGRGERFHEPQTKDLPLIVRSILEAMEPLSDLPFIFFGHSLGALIAFDVARALRRSGKRLPLHLFAAAHRAPDVLDLEPPIQLLPDAEFLQELRRLAGWFRRLWRIAI